MCRHATGCRRHPVPTWPLPQLGTVGADYSPWPCIHYLVIADSIIKYQIFESKTSLFAREVANASHYEFIQINHDIVYCMRILIIESLVLFRVQNFQQCRSRVTTDISACLVDLIQQHHWIVYANSLMTPNKNIELIYIYIHTHTLLVLQSQYLLQLPLYITNFHTHISSRPISH